MGMQLWVISVGILVTYRNRSLARSSAKPTSGSFVFGQNMGERVMVRVAILYINDAEMRAKLL